MTNHPEKCELGILFVHGIGEQPEGTTLTHCGGALAHWLNSWRIARRPQKPLKGKHKSSEEPIPLESLECTHAVLKNDGREPGAPPHAVIRVVQEPRCDHRAVGDQSGAHWLVGESHWAQVIRPPTFFNLFKWALDIYPWVSSAHFGVRLRRRWKRWNQQAIGYRIVLAPFAVALTIIYGVLSAVSTAFVMLALGLMALLAIPPIAWVRTILLRAQKVLTGTVGDSLILCSDSLQSAAIITRAQEDLKWMRQRCDRIAIIAHSQGAAVMDRALREGGALGLDKTNGLFITLGSGLGKLTEIAYALKEPSKWRRGAGWMAVVGLLVIVVALLVRSNIFPLLSWILADLGSWWVLLLGGIAWAGGVASGASANQFDDEWFQPAKAYGADIEWWDFYASEDPVSNGPLMDNPPAGLHPVLVHNRGMKLSDHSTYWENYDGFVARVAHRLTALANVDAFVKEDESFIQAAWLRRRWRVGWLRVTLTAAIVSAGFLPFAMQDELPLIGQGVASWTVRQQDLMPDFVVTWMSAVATQQPLAYLFGVVLLLAAIALLYAVPYSAWRMWNRMDMKRLIEKKPFELGAPFWIFVFCLLIFANAMLAIGAGWHHERVKPLDDSDVRNWTSISKMLIGVFGFLFIIQAVCVWFRKRDWGAAFLAGYGQLPISLPLIVPLMAAMLFNFEVERTALVIFPILIVGIVMAIFNFYILPQFERSGIVGADVSKIIDAAHADLPPLDASRQPPHTMVNQTPDPPLQAEPALT